MYYIITNLDTRAISFSILRRVYLISLSLISIFRSDFRSTFLSFASDSKKFFDET